MAEASAISSASSSDRSVCRRASTRSRLEEAQRRHPAESGDDLEPVRRLEAHVHREELPQPRQIGGQRGQLPHRAHLERGVLVDPLQRNVGGGHVPTTARRERLADAAARLGGGAGCSAGDSPPDASATSELPSRASTVPSCCSGAAADDSGAVAPGDSSTGVLGCASTSSILFSAFMAFISTLGFARRRAVAVDSACGDAKVRHHNALTTLLLHHDFLPSSLRHGRRDRRGDRRPRRLGPGGLGRPGGGRSGRHRARGDRSGRRRRRAAGEGAAGRAVMGAAGGGGRAPGSAGRAGTFVPGRTAGRTAVGRGSAGRSVGTRPGSTSPMSTRPRKLAPSTMMTRGAWMSPTMRPSRVSSTLSVAVMLPTTTPLTMAFLTVTFGLHDADGSTMSVLVRVSSTLDPAADREVLVARELAADEDGWTDDRVVARPTRDQFLRSGHGDQRSFGRPCRRCP